MVLDGNGIIRLYRYRKKRICFGYLTKMVGSRVVKGSREVMRYFGMVDGSMVGFGSRGITLVGLGMDWVAFVFDISDESILMISMIGDNLCSTVWEGNSVFSSYDSMFILEKKIIKRLRKD